MDFLHRFTVTTLLIAFLSCFCESLMCEGGLKKYASLVTGLIVALCVVNAVIQIRTVDFTVPEIAYFAGDGEDTSVRDTAVQQQFASDLEEAIEACVFERFNCQIRAYATVEVSNETVYVRSIEIDNTAIEEKALAEFVKQQFGIVPIVK